MTKKILFAKVNSVFGIKGDVKLIVFSDNPENIEKYSLFDEKEKIFSFVIFKIIPSSFF